MQITGGLPRFNRWLQINLCLAQGKKNVNKIHPKGPDNPTASATTSHHLTGSNNTGTPVKMHGDPIGARNKHDKGQGGSDPNNKGGIPAI